MTAQPRSRFRADIEGLRAVAILTVVLYHLNLFHVRGGYIGVDVFFVISGYLITGQLVATIGADGSRALPGFYARRIKRLLPAASATLVATLLAWRIWGLATLPRSTAVDGVFATFYGLNYRLAHAGTLYFNPQVAPPALQHFWSLAVEEQFYLVWPMLILIAFWHRSQRRRRNLAVALVVIGIVSLILSWRLSETTPTWAFFGLHTRAWELATGGLIALSAHRLETILRPRVAEAMTWIGTAGIAFAAFSFTNRTTYPGLAAALPVGGAALVIAGGCGNGRLGAGLLLNRRPAQLIGRLSYSWYLWHWPIIIITPFALNHILNWRERIALLVITFAVAWLSFVIVEQPMRRLPWRPGRWFAVAGGSAALVGIVAAIVIAFPKPAVGPGPAAAALPQLSGSFSAQQAAIKQAALAGLMTKTLPDNLEPDLAHAFGDTPGVPDDCFLGFGATTPSSCVFGDPAASRTLVVFGDSLMEQWMPALEQLGRQNHWRVVMWGKTACTTNAVISYNVITGRSYTSCLKWRNATVQRINALAPQKVLFGGSLRYDIPDVSADAWTKLTVDTARALAAPGREVDYLLPDPLPKTDIPTCLATHLETVTSCASSITDADQPADRRAALAAALPRVGVHVIDPSSLMCVAGGCPVVVGRVPVYRDISHVTATYALWLAPLFADVLPPA